MNRTNEAEAGARLVRHTGFSAGSGEVVAAVELHARLGRAHQHAPARIDVAGLGDGAQALVPAVDDEAVVVAVAEAELLIGDADALADGVLVAEVERGSVDGAQFPGRDGAGIRRQEMRRGNPQSVVFDARSRRDRAAEVEVRMLGQVDYGQLTGARAVFHAQGWLGRQRVGHLHL